MGAWRGEDTRGRVVKFLNKFRSRLSRVRVDAIGVKNQDLILALSSWLMQSSQDRAVLAELGYLK